MSKRRSISRRNFLQEPGRLGSWSCVGASVSCEAGSCSAVKTFAASTEPQVQYPVYKNPLPVPVLGQINPIHTLPCALHARSIFCSSLGRNSFLNTVTITRSGKVTPHPVGNIYSDDSDIEGGWEVSRHYVLEI